VKNIIRDKKTCLDSISSTLLLYQMSHILKEIDEVCHDTSKGGGAVCFLFHLFMWCFLIQSFFQIVNTYVKPRHPNVIDTHDTWHCIRAIVAGVEEILLAGGAAETTVEGLKEYMKTLLLALMVKYPGDPQRVAKEWLTFDWNRNGFSFSKDELLMLFHFAKGKVSQVLKLSTLATSIADPTTTTT